MNKHVDAPIIKGVARAPKAVRSQMDTLIFSRAEIDAIKLPAFQRPLRVNPKVREIAETLKVNGGVIEGVITLGRIGTDKSLWLVDGQHRIEAYKLSDLLECMFDVRICTFDSMAEMGEEFVNLNSAIAKFGPDDILRGLEGSNKALCYVREACPFVGYGQIRRGVDSPILSTSMLLRSWESARGEVPHSAMSALHIAEGLEEKDAQEIVVFLQTARAAWGAELENARLWGALNLTLCMWMFRRVVLGHEHTAVKSRTKLSRDQFKKCLMSVAASAPYNDWLVGRKLNERDRAPAYARLRALFAMRLKDDQPALSPRFPQAAWTTSGGNKARLEGQL